MLRMDGLAHNRQALCGPGRHPFDRGVVFDLGVDFRPRPAVRHPEPDANGHAILGSLAAQPNPDRLARGERHQKLARRGTAHRQRAAAEPPSVRIGLRLGIALERQSEPACDQGASGLRFDGGRWWSQRRALPTRLVALGLEPDSSRDSSRAGVRLCWATEAICGNLRLRSSAVFTLAIEATALIWRDSERVNAPCERSSTAQLRNVAPAVLALARLATSLGRIFLPSRSRMSQLRTNNGGAATGRVARRSLSGQRSEIASTSGWSSPRRRRRLWTISFSHPIRSVASALPDQAFP